MKVAMNNLEKYPARTLLPAGEGPHPYDNFWSKVVESRSEGPFRDIARLMIQSLPAKWLQAVADADIVMENIMERMITEDDKERCKNEALAVLWNNWDWCSRGSTGHCALGSSHAVSVYMRCLAKVLEE